MESSFQILRKAEHSANHEWHPLKLFGELDFSIIALFASLNLMPKAVSQLFVDKVAIIFKYYLIVTFNPICKDSFNDTLSRVYPV